MPKHTKKGKKPKSKPMSKSSQREIARVSKKATSVLMSPNAVSAVPGFPRLLVSPNSVAF